MKVLAYFISISLVLLLFSIPLALTAGFSYSLYHHSTRWSNENYLLENGVKVKGLVTSYTTILGSKGKRSSSFTYKYFYQGKINTDRYAIGDGFKLTIDSIGKGQIETFCIDPEDPTNTGPGFIEPHYLNEFLLLFVIHIPAIFFATFLFVFLLKETKIKKTDQSFYDWIKETIKNKFTYS